MKTTYNWTEDCYKGLEKTDPQYNRFYNIIKQLNETSDVAIARRLRTEMVLDWRDEYNVGVREIDSQHKKFFKMIQKMSDLHLKGGGRKGETAQLNQMLDELLNYTKFHFQTEEKLMERYAYPMIQHQKQEHAMILSELVRQIAAIRSARGSTAKLVYFLIQWFIKHTVYSDKDVGLFIMRQRKAQAFRFNLKGVAQNVKGFLNQPLTTGDVMNFLSQPVKLWGQ
ncbi:bacteriohemerythrin [Candidatus Electrothrix sp.]|uniref:bacteriohemerythrin n=1 Tax=Candidatus Electrothrix sp. TaxID=2170559 RepID=UPI00405747BF